MKHHTISLRRRHLVIAGLTGVAAPATLFAGQRSGTSRDAPAIAELLASGGNDKLVVSGRVVGAPDGKPLAEAVVEAWHASGSAPCASTITDGDGRFMFTTLSPAEHPGRPRYIYYRVSGQGHATRVTRLDFAPARGVADDRIAQLQRDDAGTWRATFGLTLA